MKKWFFLIIIFAIVILESAILDYFKVFGVKPNFLIISIVLAILSFNLYWALTLSIFAGIIKDILSINTFGINVLLFPLWVLLIKKLSKEIPLDNNLILITLVFILVFLNSILRRLVFLYLGSFISWGIFLRITIFESLYSALIFPLLFKIIK